MTGTVHDTRGGTGRRRAVAGVAAVAALASGCANDLSNAPFAEDAVYGAAVPAREGVHAESPEGETGLERAGGALDGGERGLGERALAVDLTLDVCGAVNGMVFAVLDQLAGAVASAPTVREEGRRVWGPSDYRDGTAYRLTVERGEDGVYAYALELAGVPADRVDEGTEWRGVLEGDFLPDGALPDGSGSFVLDAGAVTDLAPSFERRGVLRVEHARRGSALEVRVEVEGWSGPEGEVPEADYAFARDAGGGGTFEYRSTYDLVGSDGGPAEDLDVRARWRPDGAGRADAWVGGGDLPGEPMAVTECWGADLAQVYWAAPEPAGDEGACAFGPEFP
ncbi:hypothetical protein L6R50_25325 [Myxococcota bacterium]|nr:hypothetical protein [Myxococcota bacterium]